MPIDKYILRWQYLDRKGSVKTGEGVFLIKRIMKHKGRTDVSIRFWKWGGVTWIWWKLEGHDLLWFLEDICQMNESDLAWYWVNKKVRLGVHILAYFCKKDSVRQKMIRTDRNCHCAGPNDHQITGTFVKLCMSSVIFTWAFVGWFGCFEDLRCFNNFSVILRLGSNRNPISKFEVARPGFKPRTTCSTSQEL